MIESHFTPPESNMRVPRGLFLHGPVGTGKSMLMDSFFEMIPEYVCKKRVHFHSFMQDVHSRIHRLKQEDLAKNGRNFQIDTTLERNPIYRVAIQISSEVSLLCFDEFHDITYKPICFKTTYALCTNHMGFFMCYFTNSLHV